GFMVAAVGLLRELSNARRADAHSDLLGFGVSERLLDFFVDRLAPIDALALIRDFLFRARRRFFRDVAALVDIHLNPLRTGFRLREYGTRLEVGDTLLERLDSILEGLHFGCRRATGPRGRFGAGNLERLQRDRYGLRLVRHRHCLR